MNLIKTYEQRDLFIYANIVEKSFVDNTDNLSKLKTPQKDTNLIKVLFHTFIKKILQQNFEFKSIWIVRMDDF